MSKLDVSIVVPLFNEEESLMELADWIKRVCDENQLSFEVYFIDDGSTDGSWRVIADLAHKHPEVRGIRFAKNYGKSQALHIGFARAQGKVVRI